MIAPTKRLNARKGLQSRSVNDLQESLTITKTTQISLTPMTKIRHAQ